ncbi:hypothetical protein Rrhod_0585 [Rhodococcus rhodnii LMG 5362]|uniref:Uncharacterized protein n=1 Tax=Rhodococcus rhodnii LMG 5362 TaxID=1273125 RepID=R7WV69_9NOCA|nr:hypothetical protein Rrhod_0585 [Rhodococcus rhodnii LMG 5362]
MTRAYAQSWDHECPHCHAAEFEHCTYTDSLGNTRARHTPCLARMAGAYTPQEPQ